MMALCYLLKAGSTYTSSFGYEPILFGVPGAVPITIKDAIEISRCNLLVQISRNDVLFAGITKSMVEVSGWTIWETRGLLEGLWTLNEKEVLSPGQKVVVDRIYVAYPDLIDDDFVAENIVR
jgi:hypothetical protein